jgi:hypothetical protein
MPWKWFAFKSLIRTQAHGRASSPDRHYDADATLIEERIVIVRARDFKEAFRKGEAELDQYVSENHHTNPFGQRVRSRALPRSEVFMLFDEPGPGAEVFSSTHILPRSVSDSQAVERLFGPRERSRRLRTKFLNSRFSGRR